MIYQSSRAFHHRDAQIARMPLVVDRTRRFAGITFPKVACIIGALTLFSMIVRFL